MLQALQVHYCTVEGYDQSKGGSTGQEKEATPALGMPTL